MFDVECSVFDVCRTGFGFAGSACPALRGETRPTVQVVISPGMMKKGIVMQRREFLKQAALGVGALALTFPRLP
jgi:hypothetical protein